MNGSTIISKAEEVVDRKRLSMSTRLQLFVGHYFFQTNRQTGKIYPRCNKFNRNFFQTEALIGRNFQQQDTHLDKAARAAGACFDTSHKRWSFAARNNLHVVFICSKPNIKIA
jgi:hypothetical protein